MKECKNNEKLKYHHQLNKEYERNKMQELQVQLVYKK